jgi:hypothetical protein
VAGGSGHYPVFVQSAMFQPFRLAVHALAVNQADGHVVVDDQVVHLLYDAVQQTFTPPP